MIKEGSIADLPGIYDVFIGNIGGCIGETLAAALLIGFAILLYKGIINRHIPVVYIGTGCFDSCSRKTGRTIV